MSCQQRAVARLRQAQRFGQQFIELAVNIPEQEPQVGHADVQPDRSGSQKLSGLPPGSSLNQIELDDLIGQFGFPGLHRPPETKITGIFRRREAISIPG